MAHLFRGKDQAKLALNGKRMETQLLPETQWNKEPLPDGTPPEDSVVVTITRQFGSGGAAIARLVADEASLNYIDQEIIAQVATRSGIDAQNIAGRDEQSESTSRYIMEAVKASQPFNVNYSSLFNTTTSLEQSKEVANFQLTQRVILEVATQGNVVIVGRGSQFLLHTAPRTLHIYIFAPLPHRIANVMKNYQLDHSAAEQLIERRDAERDNYLRRYYGTDGHRPGLYHLLINTSLFSIELAAHLIKQALPLVKEIV